MKSLVSSHSVGGGWGRRNPILDPTCLLVPKEKLAQAGVGSQPSNHPSPYTSWASAHRVTLPVPNTHYSLPPPLYTTAADVKNNLSLH